MFRNSFGLSPSQRFPTVAHQPAHSPTQKRSGLPGTSRHFCQVRISHRRFCLGAGLSRLSSVLPTDPRLRCGWSVFSLSPLSGVRCLRLTGAVCAALDRACMARWCSVGRNYRCCSVPRKSRGRYCAPSSSGGMLCCCAKCLVQLPLRYFPVLASAVPGWGQVVRDAMDVLHTMCRLLSIKINGACRFLSKKTASRAAAMGEKKPPEGGCGVNWWLPYIFSMKSKDRLSPNLG